MTDPAKIFDDGSPADAPGMHAIILGVGHHWHLHGGKGPETQLPKAPMINQLSSPPHSARAMADFVLKTYHGDKTHPLRSLSMLVSEPQQSTFANLLVPKVKLVDPTIANIKSAIEQWKLRGDQHKDNLLFFYICCHGLSAGLQHTLLASDFANEDGELFENAIDFTEFHRAMGDCEAKQQVYFVDACRTMSPNLLEDQFKGDPLIDADPIVAPRTSPVFRSSLAGDPSWATRNAPSPFCRSIQLAYQGSSWRQEQGTWVVCSSQLKSAVENQIKRVMRRFPGFPHLIDRDNDVTFTLKVIEDGIEPLVPLDITCTPEDANEQVHFELQKLGSAAPIDVPTRAASKHPWLLDVPFGIYDLTASFPGGAYQATSLNGFIVYPPSGSKLVEVFS